ncbi:MAG: TIGR00730 family Rossman fold protein [Planctomycetaceae bacterium]
MAPRKPRLPQTDVSETHPLPTEHTPIDDGTQFLIDEIKETADKLQRDQAARGDLKIISRALKELRYAFKVFKPFRKQRKVTVFGSARLKPDHPSYQQAVEYGRRMAKYGWYVVTGAGGGIMEAAHVGAGRKMSMGLNIVLPFEQEANYVINDDEKLVNLKYFFTRKLLFVKEVHAVVLFPGGFGTQDELFETLTLVQTGKRDLMPIVLVDEPGGGYWAAWLKFAEAELRETGLISPDDFSLFCITDKVGTAVNEVLGFYSVYNSMRYIRDELYLRLHRPVGATLLDELNRDFADIIESGTIREVEPHPFESDEPHLADLHRIAFKFNRHDTARLRQLVDRINDELGASDEEEEEEE